MSGKDSKSESSEGPEYKLIPIEDLKRRGDAEGALDDYWVTSPHEGMPPRFDDRHAN